MSSKISAEVRAQVREQAQNRCGYCLSLQKYVLGVLEIEHIIPKAVGGSDDENNLWLACRLCNNYKAAKTHGYDSFTNCQVRLFNPRTQGWWQHFRWSRSGTHIIGMTACGRATVEALQLNNAIAVAVREAWVSAGWHPPKLE